MKVLHSIHTAYRATLEEQDDTAVWLVHAMRAAGAEMAVLLSGPAVNYACEAASAEGLRIGDWQQHEAPRVAEQLRGLVAKGVPVFVLLDDAAARGLSGAQLVEGLQYVEAGELPALHERFDQVWRW